MNAAHVQNVEEHKSSPPGLMANKPEKQFENLGLLKSLLGENKRASLVHSVASSQASFPLPSRGEPQTRYSALSLATLGLSQGKDRGDDAPASSTKACLLPYKGDSHGGPRIGLASNTPSTGQATGPVPRAQTSPDTAPKSSDSSAVSPLSGVQQATNAPETSSHSGLKALFQAPVRLKSNSLIASTDQSSIQSFPQPRHSSSDLSRTVSPELSEKQSMTSLGSQSSGSSVHSLTQPVASSFQIYHSHYSLPLPARSESFEWPKTGPGPTRPSFEPHRNSYSAYRPSVDRGRSQLFVYQPRRVISPPNGSENSALSDSSESVIFELEGTPSAFIRPIEVEVARPRNDTKTESAEQPDDKSEDLDKMDTGQVLISDTISSVSAPGKNRDEIDSEAWQRRTRMFQIEDPDGHLRMKRP